MKLLFLLIFVAASTGMAAESSPEQIAMFEKKIRPILVNHCYNCHSANTKPAGGLRVDDRNGLLTGGDSGPAVVSGHPEDSLLLKRVLHDNPKRRMPKEGSPLTKAEVDDLAAWIKDGVAWPAEQIPASFGRPKPSYEGLKARHWAFQPIADPKLPVVSKASWPREDLDRFILAKLEAKKLSPVADADRVTLIRRLTFDLTGLPPTPAEIDGFVHDRSAHAYERLVDRLLQSPRFGERWGRHWLDVARYGESTGPSRNIPYPHAWRYRDYVIYAVNRDVPFDRFLQEQVAGDLLPAANTEERDRLLIATGFLALGPKDVNQRFKERFQMDNVDEKIDTVSRSALGLTVSCARCHDHKFDPIPTTDYYALAGIFISSDDAAGLKSRMGGAGLDYYDPKLLVQLASYVPQSPTEKVAKLEAEVAVAKKEWESIRGTPEGLALGPNGKPKQQPFRRKYERLQGELLALTDPASYGYAVHGAREAKVIADTAVRIRGQAERLGPTVPRGFLTAFAVPDAPPVNPAQSGRLELAKWLTSPSNPLTSRVIVNRVWQHLFGEGIVKTVDNFGVNGDRPSHPELLDHLASRFIREGWSVKKLVRTIVLSRAYRLSSEAPPEYREIDPANRLVWRHSPRRLEAEEIRDAMLASAGRLQLQPPPGSPARELKMIEMRDNGPESRTINEKADASVVRSVYLPLLRGVTPKSIEAFDPVTQTLVTGQRDATTVPTQALYLLNSVFVRRQALSLADTVRLQSSSKGIQQAYRLTLGRDPSRHEILRAEKFIAEFESSYVSVPPAIAAKPLSEKPSDEQNADPDNIDRTDYIVTEEIVQPADAKAAAWMSFVQALYASAEFRFVR
jgi:hypothetical protein